MTREDGSSGPDAPGGPPVPADGPPLRGVPARARTRGGPSPLEALERALIPAAALRAGVETGLLRAIAAAGEPPVPAGDAARRCGLDAHRAGVLLDVLADCDLVVRTGGGYRAHPDVPRLAPLMARSLAGLPAAVKRTPPAVGRARDLYPRVVGLLGELVAAAADRVARRLAAPGAHVLDLGAGAAPWSLAILRREPTARLTAVDRPDVLPATRAAAEAAGVADRASFVAADLTADRLHANADVVILAHVCHLFDDGQAADIVRRAAGSLAPAGRLAIIDYVAADAGHDERRGSLRRYELGLFARTGTGRVHDLAALRRWCAAAGLERHEVHDVGGDAGPMTMLIAERLTEGGAA